MRSCSTALAVWLDSTTSTERPRHLVTVTLRNGTVYRWTDHTVDLAVGGNTFYAGGQGTTHPIVKVGKSSQLAGLDIASLSLTLECGVAAMLGSKRLPLAAAQRAFDGATVKVERVFLAMPGAILPASHRYWRLYATAVDGSTRLSLNEIQFRATPGGADVTAPGMTVTASSTSFPFSPAGAIDNTAVGWASGYALPAWLAVDLGVGVAADVREFTLEASTEPTAAPKNFEIQYSDDGSTWTTRATVTGSTGWSSGVTRTFTFNDVQESPQVSADAVLQWFEGLVGEVTPFSTRVEVEVESGVAALSVEIPRRRFTPGCGNTLFDAQCGLSKATYTATRTVSSPSASVIAASGCAEATGWFDLGVLTITSGSLAGESRAVRSYTLGVDGEGAFVLDRPLPSSPTGLTFTVYPGCDKRLTTCATKFGDNSARFTGFPAIPREGPLPSPSSVGSTARAGGGLGPLPPAKESSTYGEPIPLVYGKTRVAAKTIYAGPASNNPPIADSLGALCEGPIGGVVRVFTGGTVGPAAAGVAGISTFTALTGTRPTQTPWSRLPSGKNLGYPGTALIGQTVQLENGRPPEQTWEILGMLPATGGSDGDAHPAQVIRDVLGRDPTTGAAKTHDPYGAQFPFPVEADAGLALPSDPVTPAACSFTRWVEQNAFWLSPALTTRRAARDWLEELLEAVNAEALWSEGKLKIIPRGDAAVGTFSPVTSVRYTLTRADLAKDGSGPVHMELAPEADSYNLAPVRFRERAPVGVASDATLAYQEATEQDPDPVDVSIRGERPAGTVELLGVTRREHALKIARMRAQRLVRVRRTIEVAVGWRFCRLEPLDLVTVTDDLLPLAGEPMVIREIEEDPETMSLRITAEHWEGGVNLATAHLTQSSDGGTTQWGPYELASGWQEASAGLWTRLTGLPATVDAIASNGSRTVAVGASTCLTSDDHGETWISRTIPAGTYYAVRYVEWLGLWIAAGAGVAASSPDGENWTARSIGAGTYYALADSGSAVIAVGASTMARSTNGTSWITQAITGTYYGAAWSGSVVAAVGPGYIATAPADGVTWTPRTNPGAVSLIAVASDHRIILALGSNGSVATAPVDGVTWTAQAKPPVSNVSFGRGALIHSGLTFFAPSVPGTSPVGPAGFVWTTRDGKTWRWVQATTTDELRCAAWSGKRFLITTPTTAVWRSLVL